MVTYPVNAVNESGASGLVNFDGTSAFSTTALTQYNVLTGASNKTVNNVAPSATSGIPLVSGGSAAQPSFGTAVVAGGGTGATSLSGIVLGNGTSAMTTLSFTDWTSFMPTLFGATTAGTTVYSIQQGYYCTVANLCFMSIFITVTSVTGTGNVNIGGLPVTMSSALTSLVNFGTVLVRGFTWPSGVTQLALEGLAGTTNAQILGSQSAGNYEVLQMAAITQTTSVIGNIIITI